MGAAAMKRHQQPRPPREAPPPSIFGPSRVDLRHTRCFPYAPVPDQGESVSCVAQAFSAALYCAQVSGGLGKPLVSNGSWFPDTESLYAHALAESPNRAKGVSFGSVIARVRDVYGEMLNRLGVIIEELPNDVENVRIALRAGSPVVAGYQVNSDIEAFHRSAEAREAHGLVLPPFWRDPQPVSAHAVLIIGYDDNVGCFIARNSWGPSWGSDGHFLIRYRDIQDEDAFTDLVSVGPPPSSPSPSIGSMS